NREPLAHVAQPDAFPTQWARGDHRVRNSHRQLLIVPLDLDTYRHGTFVPGKAVNDRVLHEWLENEAGHPHAREHIHLRQAQRQAISEALLLQLEVRVDEVELVRETREIPLARVQQPTQQIAELHDHRLRLLRIPADLAANRVQKVEQ